MKMTRFEHLDNTFKFGKFKGCTLGEVLTFNPEYVEWVVKNVSGRMCIIEDSAIQEIELIFPNFLITDEFEDYRKMRIFENEEVEDESYDDDFDDPFSSYLEEPTYGRYAGSYAQDEMGYSDDDIDIIFDGNPDAYWNID